MNIYRVLELLNKEQMARITPDYLCVGLGLPRREAAAILHRLN